MEKLADDNKIIITDENGKERECEILFTYECKENGKNYVVLYPVEDIEGEGETDLFAFSFVENKENEGELFNLEDDAEVELVNNIIDNYFKDQEAAENEEE